MLLRLSLAASLLSLVPLSTLAQPASVYVDIGPCMALESDGERYACYDRLESQIRAAQSRDTQTQVQTQIQPQTQTRSEPQVPAEVQLQGQELPVVSLPRNTRQADEQSVAVQQPASSSASESAPEPEPESVAGFGLETPATTSNRQTNARVLENEDGGQEMMDTVVSLDERVPGQWQITLASGQVWRQTNSKRFRLREGMEVRIYPSSFGGSFRLSASGLNGFIQVQRVQ